MNVTVSIREFARLDGCNDKLVRRAIKSGKLAVDESGRLDPSLAGTPWRMMNHPGHPKCEACGRPLPHG